MIPADVRRQIKKRGRGRQVEKSGEEEEEEEEAKTVNWGEGDDKESDKRDDEE